jgi:hypothetical protein
MKVIPVTYLMKVIPESYLMKVIPETYMMKVIPETYLMKGVPCVVNGNSKSKYILFEIEILSFRNRN